MQERLERAIGEAADGEESPEAVRDATSRDVAAWGQMPEGVGVAGVREVLKERFRPMEANGPRWGHAGDSG